MSMHGFRQTIENYSDIVFWIIILSADLSHIQID